ncbi:MAG: hypothetical protein ACYC59_03690 [Anaerolineaceae bacterium]
MARSRIFGTILNPIIKSILRSPLHPLMSDHSLVIQYMGREFGKEHSFPAYYQQEGNSLQVLVEKTEDWWRSLKNGANVKVIIKGNELRGWAEAIQDAQSVKKNFLLLLNAIPELSTELEVRRDENSVYSTEDIEKNLQQLGLLTITLQTETA